MLLAAWPPLGVRGAESAGTRARPDGRQIQICHVSDTPADHAPDLFPLAC